MKKTRIWKILKWVLGIVLGLILSVYILLYFFKNDKVISINGIRSKPYLIGEYNMVDYDNKT